MANGILNYAQNIGSNVMGGANWLADRASNIVMNQVPNRYLDYRTGRTKPVTDIREIAPTRSTQNILTQGIASNIARKGYDFSNPFSSVVQSTGGGGEHGLGRTVDYGGYKLGNPLKAGLSGSLGELSPYFNMLTGSAENQIANTLGDYTVNYNPSTQLGPQVTPESMNIFDRYDFKGKEGEGWGTPYDINVNLSPQMIKIIKANMMNKKRGINQVGLKRQIKAEERQRAVNQVRQNIQTYGNRDRPNIGINRPGGGYGQSPTGGDVAGTPFSRGGILGAF